MKDLLNRGITGIVFVGLVILSILTSYFLFALVFLAFSVIGLWEFYSISSHQEIKPLRWLGVLTGLVFYITNMLVAFHLQEAEILSVNLVFLVAIYLTELYRKDAKHFSNVAITITGIVYIILPFSLLLYFLEVTHDGSQFNSTFLLSIFILIWVNDTGAFLVGRLIGKHKLFESISPKKSWEGAVGGVLLSVLSVLVIATWERNLTLPEWVGAALIVSIGSIFGDLIESLLKRGSDRKDSGSILPGHGGLLDRLDSLLIAAPLLFIYVTLIR